MDLTGERLNEEIIVEARHGAGLGHYIEDVRIFKDNYPNLDLIFTVRTLDSTFGFEKEMSKYNCDIISTIEFSEKDPKNGTRDITVKTKKIYYKDTANKVVNREVDLGTKIYKWNGKQFKETKSQKNG